MKATIVGKPVAFFVLDKRQCRILMECGSMHYDSTCREAVSRGGFVYGWNNSPSSCRGTVRELALACKILALPHPDEYLRPYQQELTNAFHGMAQQSMCSEWSKEITV